MSEGQRVIPCSPFPNVDACACPPLSFQQAQGKCHPLGEPHAVEATEDDQEVTPQNLYNVPYALYAGLHFNITRPKP
jgi:hypothetical protein